MQNSYTNLPPRPMTRKQAAEYLQRSERTIDRMIADGELAAFHIGRSVRVDPASVASKVQTSK